eukprot:2377816-Prymnesium_polylepis.1
MASLEMSSSARKRSAISSSTSESLKTTRQADNQGTRVGAWQRREAKPRGSECGTARVASGSSSALHTEESSNARALRTEESAGSWSRPPRKAATHAPYALRKAREVGVAHRYLSMSSARFSAAGSIYSSGMGATRRSCDTLAVRRVRFPGRGRVRGCEGARVRGCEGAR